MKVLNEERLRFFGAAQGMSLFGHAVALFAGHPVYASVAFDHVTAYLAAAIRHQQLKCYFNDDNQLTGMVVWMWFDEPLLQRIYQANHYPPSLHISEWKEGDIYFVADIVAHRRSLREIVRDVRANIPSGASKVAWINSRRGKLRTMMLHKRRGVFACGR